MTTKITNTGITFNDNTTQNSAGAIRANNLGNSTVGGIVSTVASGNVRFKQLAVAGQMSIAANNNVITLTYTPPPVSPPPCPVGK